MFPNELLETVLRRIKYVIPTALFRALAPMYHFLLAFLSALYYGFPSRKILVVAVTGTNGKTTVTELVNAILEEAGYMMALSNTLRFKVGRESVVNVFKMTMPGRFFLQRFLREAVNATCRYAVIELTSEGARQSRHLFIALDALIFTNLTPEHVESHGSFENYRDAKRKLARALASSGKPKKYIVANIDDAEGKNFLRIAGRGGAERIPYALSHVELLAAAAFARSQGVSVATIKRAIEKFKGTPGRVEKVELPASSGARQRQNFSVYVDYAHTPDALENLYGTFPAARKICVLGACGGGRDKWKRPELGRIAAEHCDEIILTNEDPYDEDPQGIINEIAEGVLGNSKFSSGGGSASGGQIPNSPPKEDPPPADKFFKILDREKAIEEGIRRAKAGDVVLITGKGTDPYIMGPNGTKIPWNDAEVARSALKKMLK
ncbi:MAG: hypothetical protein HYY92_00285 [Parcubacteria group bacterium]|nr:hypothetical protein [Parcubacteria group bacterium]